MRVISDGIKEELISNASKDNPEKSGTISKKTSLIWDLELIVKDNLGN